MKGVGMKWLRILHIVSASIWFGGTVCIGVLAIICFFNLSENAFLTVAPLIPMLYKKAILPMAIFIMIQGLIYGSFTKWGFIKHRWIILKWVLTLSLGPCIGMGTIGQLFSVIDKVSNFGFSGGFADGGRILFLYPCRYQLYL